MEPQASLPHDPASDIGDAIVVADTESIADDTVIDARGEATAALQIEAAELTPQTADANVRGDEPSDATVAEAEPRDDEAMDADVEPREETTAAGDEPRDDATPAGDEPRDAQATGDGLSPSVRRLVRQYDLDVTRIHGTGPEGRIRVADVVALIGTRSDAPGDAALRYASATARKAPVNMPDESDSADDGGGMNLDEDDDRDARAPLAAAASQEYVSEEPQPVAAVAAASAAAPVTTVFECDLGRVLAHRKRQAQHSVEPTITSYYLVACGAALASVPEVGADADHVGEIGVWLATSDGDAKPLLIDIAAEPPGTPPGARVQGVDLRIRAAATSVVVTAAAANPDDDPFAGAKTSMLVHQHGASGSLLATATPLGKGHAASLGIGRVRKQIVVRSVEGDEGPRVAALAYLTLSFDPRRVTLPRANRFMSELVRALEHWPEN